MEPTVKRSLDIPYNSLCECHLFIIGGTALCVFEAFLLIALVVMTRLLYISSTVHRNVKYTVIHLLANVFVQNFFWFVRKLSHLFACLVDYNFVAFPGLVCAVQALIIYFVTFAQWWLLILIPCEQVYAVIYFGKKEAARICTLSIYIALIYLGSAVRYFQPSMVSNLATYNNNTAQLCLNLSPSMANISISLQLSLLQILFPFASLLLALKVRSVAKKIYRSYVDRKSKLTVDERLEVEGVITAAKAVSAISVTACLVYPYNLLLRILAVEICYDHKVCLSVVYVLTYSIGRCVATGVMLYALGHEIKEVRRKMRRILGLRSNKVGMVTEMTVVENYAKEAEARFTYLRDQWNAKKF